MDPTVEALQTQIDDLRAQIAALTAVEPPGSDADAAPARASRRNVLRLAGAAVAGAAAAGIAGSGRAAAVTGYTTGGPISVGDVVRQTQTATRPGQVAFLFRTPGGTASNDTDNTAALGGWAYDGLTKNGVYGYSNTDDGAGMYGLADGVGGTAVFGLSVGVAGIGVSGTGTDIGVIGSGGLFGGYGLATAETSSGLYGATSGNLGAGVVGVSSGTAESDGVRGTARRNGGVFSGGKGALVLSTNGETKPPPATRTVAHLTGTIEVDNAGGLWHCVAAGTPGTWRQLSGPDTAGAFHPITPARVYDSRIAVPTPGTIAAGTDRTISVADGRDLGTGAVTTPNIVPAGASAVACNVTVVATAAAGFLTLNPGGVTTVGAASVNWYANGQTLNNGTIARISPDRTVTIVAGGGGATHVVVDITGYWR